MSANEGKETWRDDAVLLDRDAVQDGLITESHEPKSKESYHHSHHHHSEHSHHHHHSRRHHRHSGSRKKNGKRENTLKQFLRRNKKYLLYTALALIFFICAVFAGIYLDRMMGTAEGQAPSDGYQSTDGNLLISVPTFDGEVSLSTSAVQAYFSKGPGVTVNNIYERYQGGTRRLDVGAPVTLSYKIKGAPIGYTVEGAVFYLSEDPHFSNPIEKWVDATETKADFYNLKTGTQYDYRIDIHFTNGKKSSVGGQFFTAAGPRLMTVDGVYNMRDIGGWTTADGRVVRQGLLYRGCELDGAVENKYTITKEGMDTLLKELGIKTDMDLRLDSENPHSLDVLGGNVEHIHYGAPMYRNVFNATYYETMRKIFSDLANRDQYPAYLHCTYGRDSTGTVCYLLGALLGVSQENLVQDYELSALCHGSVADEDFTVFMQRVNELPGATLSEKVEGYLLSIGVTPQEIANIREIFLD